MYIKNRTKAKGLVVCSSRLPLTTGRNYSSHKGIPLGGYPYGTMGLLCRGELQLLVNLLDGRKIFHQE